MLILIFQILYYLVFAAMCLMSIFIAFHILAYSYSYFSKIMTITIFASVAGTLLFSNFLLFKSVDLAQVLVGMLL